MNATPLMRPGLIVVVRIALAASERVAIVQNPMKSGVMLNVRMWLPGSCAWSSTVEIAESQVVRVASREDMLPVEKAAGGNWVWSEGGPRDASTAGVVDGRGNW